MADYPLDTQATPLPSQDTLQTLVNRVLKQASVLGASQAEAAISADAGLSVTVRNGELETVEYHRDKGLGITVFFGQRKGNASTTDFSDSAVDNAVQAGRIKKGDMLLLEALGAGLTWGAALVRF